MLLLTDGGEQIVADKLEQVAVEFVCTGLRDSVDVTTCLTTVPRGDAAGFDFEFLQRIRERKRLPKAAVLVGMRSSIKVVRDTVAQSTVHRNEVARVEVHQPWVFPIERR